MKVTAEKKNREHGVVFNYTDLSEKESLKRAKAEIKKSTKLIDGWKFKVK